MDSFTKGYSPFFGMNQHDLLSVEWDQPNNVVTFFFAGGSKVKLGVEGDCCSTSWIEHLELPNSVVGLRIVAVEALPTESDDSGQYDLLQIYQTIFRLSNGDSIKLEYRNSSNGYYGGYIVRLK